MALAGFFHRGPPLLPLPRIAGGEERTRGQPFLSPWNALPEKGTAVREDGGSFCFMRSSRLCSQQ